MRTRRSMKSTIDLFTKQMKCNEETAQSYLERADWKYEEAARNYKKHHPSRPPILPHHTLRALNSMYREKLDNIIDRFSASMYSARIDRKFLILIFVDDSFESFIFERDIGKNLNEDLIFTKNFRILKIDLSGKDKEVGGLQNFIEMYKPKKIPTFLIIDCVTGETLMELKNLTVLDDVYEQILRFMETYNFDQMYPVDQDVVEIIEPSKNHHKRTFDAEKFFEEMHFGNKRKHCIEEKAIDSLCEKFAEKNLNEKPILENGISHKNISNIEETLNLMCKLPDGSRKALTFSKYATIADLNREILKLNFVNIEVNTKPGERSLLVLPRNTPLIDVCKNNSILYIIQDDN